ncbi:MAG: C69 family dipeptidase, partial [Woeseiaceae bacterium]
MSNAVLSKTVALSATLFALLLATAPAWSSYGIYVGRNLTEDGSVFLGGSGDEVSSHWLEIVPAKDHPAGETIKVGVDASAILPGEFIEIPQVPHTARYITMNYSEYEGFPPPLTNGGLNEYGVAARDIWSDSRDELIKMTPNPQHGPNYSDLARIVMERAHSAEEAVEIVGQLIDKYGYSSYGGNSHLFADAKEGWVLIDYAGGRGLWIARRLGPDEVFMSYPGHIGAIPLDFKKNPDFRGSPNFIDFAVGQGWYDPKSGKPFDADAIYGTSYVRYPREELPQELKAAKPVTLRRMLDTVRDRRISNDATGYGQVAQLKKGVRAELRTLWV